MNGMEETALRGKQIIRTSVIGIFANAMLAAFKAAVGLLSGSIAIVLDAVNNLSDALSSVITIIGAHYAQKKPDREHPLGHGRAEYLSAAVISVIVLYAGVTSFAESVKKLVHPEAAEYTAAGIIIIAVAVLVKIALGLYVRSVGEKIRSDALVDSGKDALMDSVISASTIVAAAIFLVSGISLEAWLGAGISVIIIKSGYEMLADTFSSILGKRPDSGLSRGVKSCVGSFPQVSGVYDLLLHNYGPDRFMGSVHIEVSDTLTANEIDELTRAIQQKVFLEQGVILEAVGIYSLCTTNPEIVEIRRRCTQIVYEHEYILQMHGFRVDIDKKSLYMDIIIDFAAPDRQAIYEHIRNDLRAEYPGYEIQLAMDIDASD